MQQSSSSDKLLIKNNLSVPPAGSSQIEGIKEPIATVEKTQKQAEQHFEKYQEDKDKTSAVVANDIKTQKDSLKERLKNRKQKQVLSTSSGDDKDKFIVRKSVSMAVFDAKKLDTPPAALIGDKT